MRPAFVTFLFLALILPVFAASLAPPQFCSKCPRKDNADHPLQAEHQEAAYIHCSYKDTDCYYGPKSTVKSISCLPIYYSMKLIDI